METTMKYLALIYTKPGSEPAHGTPEFQEFMESYFAVTETYKKADVMLGGEGLQPKETATTIRVRDGKTEAVDGPFAETKEVLGGFYLFECENLDEAIKYAEMIPSAKFGSIEIRPVMDYG